MVEDAIGIALNELYSTDEEVPKAPRSARKNIMRVAVMNLHFTFNKMYQNQSDSLQWLLRCKVCV